MALTPYQLGRLFYKEARPFEKASHRAKGVKLYIEYGPCVLEDGCDLRSLAYSMTNKKPPMVVLHFRLLFSSKNRLIGVIRHELGHICDPMPFMPGSEQRADNIAESIAGAKIRYDREDVQTIGRGVWPRPKYLPR